MKTLHFLGALCLGISASGAFAADVSIKGGFSQTVDGSDNYFLSNSPSGATIRSLSAVNLGVIAQTPTTRYLLDSNYSYYKYFGPGAADTALTWGTPANATFSINHTTELSKYNLAASWTRTDAATTQLAQSGVVTTHGSINTYNINGGVTRDLSRLDSVSWTAQFSTTSFTDQTQTPYNDYTSTDSAGIISLSQTTTLNNSVNLDWYSGDDPAKSQRLFWKVLTGINSQLSTRLKVTGDVGIGFVNAYQNGMAQATTTGFQPQVGTANSILWDFGLTYSLLKTTKISLTAAQAVGPTSYGQLQKTQSIGLNLSHQINERSSLSAATSFSYLLAGQGSSAAFATTTQTSNSEFFTASLNYSYKLARHWNTNLSYTYLQRNDNTGIARSNLISIALNYDFTLLGNPTAFNKAEQERSRARAQQSVGYVFPGLLQ